MSVGSATSAPIVNANLEQPVSSNLSTFIKIGSGAIGTAAIAMEGIRYLNKEVEILSLIDQYLPSPTTNLMIATSAFAVFAATFMLRKESRGSEESLLKTLAQPVVPVAPKSEKSQSKPVEQPVVSEAQKDDPFAIPKLIKLYIRYFDTHPYADNREKHIKFLNAFKKEVDGISDGEKIESSVDKKWIERLEELKTEYLVFSPTTIAEFFEKTENFCNNGKNNYSNTLGILRVTFRTLKAYPKIFILTKGEYAKLKKHCGPFSF